MGELLINTGGPIESGIPVNVGIQGMVTAIADDVDDTTGEYDFAIRRAIMTAVRYCERLTFYFNETRDIIFQTVPGQAFYSSDEISGLIKIQSIYRQDSAGQLSILRYRTPEDMELSSDTSAARGQPGSFSYFNKKLRIYPIPNAVETMRIQAGPYRTAFDVNDIDDTVWTTDAYDMIKARAKYVLYKDTLKDATMAAEALNDFNDQRDALKGETAQRNGSGYVEVTCF